MACSSAVSTVKTSPAPSQSDDVIMGGCVCVNPLLEKYFVTSAILSDRKRSSVELKGVRVRRWGIVRRNSGVWYFFCSGNVCMKMS